MAQNIVSCVVLRFRIRLKLSLKNVWVSSLKPDSEFEFQCHCTWDTTLHLIHLGSDAPQYLSSYQHPTIALGKWILHIPESPRQQVEWRSRPLPSAQSSRD